MRWTATLLILLLATVALSGCLGGDDSPTTSTEDDLADEATATADTGSITGQVVTSDLEVLPNALVALIDGGTAIEETRTDKQGRYTLNGVEPGTYRLQVTAACCKMALQEVTVTAGAVTEKAFKLDALSAEDLQTPFMREEEWPGFISCGVGAGVPGVSGVGSLAACALLDDTPVEDPNEEFIYMFEFHKGVQDAVFVLDWDAAGGVSGTDFWFLVEHPDYNLTSEGYTYAEEMGPAPLRADVHNSDIAESEWKWSAIEDSREIAFRVFASPDTTNAVYQQPFVVYYTAFHHMDAPEDYDPIPDQ